MSVKSSIEWTEATWNPVTGCTKVSEGCDHCYAETFAERFRGVTGHPYEQGFDLKLWPERLDMPLHWKKPRLVFVNSMSDLFHDDVPDWFIYAIWRVMAETPQHTYQILTKRPARMARWFSLLADTGGDAPPTLWRPGEDAYGKTFGATREEFEVVRNSGRGRMWEAWRLSLGEPPEGAAHPSFDWLEGDRWWPTVLPNVWLGTSIENQKWADVRIPHLLRTPAAVRFLSCEPLLGPINLDLLTLRAEGPELYTRAEYIGWVIVGGESGPEHRPMNPEWARSLRDQCVAAEVPFFFKQWGGRTPKTGGRDLDGRTWDEMPVSGVPT